MGPSILDLENVDETHLFNWLPLFIQKTEVSVTCCHVWTHVPHNIVKHYSRLQLVARPLATEMGGALAGVPQFCSAGAAQLLAIMARKMSFPNANNSSLSRYSAAANLTRGFCKLKCSAFALVFRAHAVHARRCHAQIQDPKFGLRVRAVWNTQCKPRACVRSYAQY